MPIYEYSCGQCKDDFELLVFKSDEPACPKCGSKKVSVVPGRVYVVTSKKS